MKKLYKLLLVMMVLQVVVACTNNTNTISAYSTLSVEDTSVSETSSSELASSSDLNISLERPKDQGFPVGDFILDHLHPSLTNTPEDISLITMSYDEYFSVERDIPFHMGSDIDSPKWEYDSDKDILYSKNDLMNISIDKVTKQEDQYGYIYYVRNYRDFYILDKYSGISMLIFSAPVSIIEMSTNNILTTLWLSNGEIWRCHIFSKTADLITVSDDPYKGGLLGISNVTNKVVSWQRVIPSEELQEEDLIYGVYLPQREVIVISYHVDLGYIYISMSRGYISIDEVTDELIEADLHHRGE